MSKKAAGATRVRDRAKPRQGDRDADAARGIPAFKPLPPFKPRPRLFYGLLAAVALWVCLLLGLYFFTVFPNRDAHGSASPAVAPERETVSQG
jgi:hypothetical protein